MTDGDSDFNSLRGICEENGTAFRVVYGAGFSVADGITAYCRSGIATAFVIENGDNSFSAYRQYSENEYVREALNTDTTVFYGRSQPTEIQTALSGHYRLNE